MICERIPASSVKPATSLPWPRTRLMPTPLGPARRRALPPGFPLPAAVPESLFPQGMPQEEQDAERWDGMA